MKRFRPLLVALAAVMLMTVACGEKQETPEAAPFPVNFDPKIFDETSATIDNPYWPMKPGTQWTWQGTAFDGEEEIERGLIATVTDLTKEIAGVKTRVVWERDFNDGALAEAEIIFFAQDKAGNVWHFGQYSEVFDEEGVLDGGTAWLVGYLEGAKAGIMVQANPRINTPAYPQGFAPAPYLWNDVAQVAKTGAKTCVLTGCYNDVIIIEEFEPNIPDAFQLKYYARGVGNVRTGWRGKGEEEREELQLVKLSTLTDSELAAVHAEALKMQTRASLFGKTRPMSRGAA